MAQNLIEELKMRNKNLEDELQTMRDLFQNLHQEKGLESLDQRRAFMLKAQNYQLERQCMLLSQAQSSRASVLIEIECQLQKFSEQFEALVSAKKQGPDVTVRRAQIMEMLTGMKRLKNSLYKQSQLEASDSQRIPSLMSGSKFSKSMKPLDCLDVSMPKSPLDNLNLKHVANLEQDLSELYKRLSHFSAALNSSTLGYDSSDAQEKFGFREQYLSPTLGKLQHESEKCTDDLQHCCDQLLSLSLLHPSAPWSVLKKSSKFDDFEFEKIMSSLPVNAQKSSQIKSSVKGICKAHNYTTHMQRLQISSLQTQLDLHKATSKIQQQYLMKLSSILMEDYAKWKDSTLNSVCKPIGEVMQSWAVLKNDQNNANLQKFLSEFKKCETELERVSMLQSPHAKVDELFSDLKGHLNQDLDRVVAEYEIKIAEAEHALKQHKDQNNTS